MDLRIDLIQIARQTLDALQPHAESLIAIQPGRVAVHLLVLNPGVRHGEGHEKPAVLASQTYGDSNKESWSKPFDELALGKARVSWRTGLSSRYVGENASHLLEEGDCKYPGSIVENGLIFAASGLEWVFDEALAKAGLGLFDGLTRQVRDRIIDNRDQLYIV